MAALPSTGLATQEAPDVSSTQAAVGSAMRNDEK